MSKTGRPTLIDQAGPSRAPAAVLHPDDPLPKTWPSLRSGHTAASAALLRLRNMGVGTLRDIDAQLAEHGLKREPRPQIRKTADGVMEPLSGPPAPGLDLERARWLGERITYATGYGTSDLVPHARRRSAARRSLARVAGYEASRPDEDALYIGSGALVLAQLNEYARRVLDEGETPITGGTDNALL